MKIEVPNGEIADKYTILKIKLNKSAAMSQQYFNIHEEYTILDAAIKILNINDRDILELYEINKKLWQIEDDIRQLEKLKQFDDLFVKLARDVYITNDKRFQIKKRINEISNSKLTEEKILPNY
jgi:hypothetical protein